MTMTQKEADSAANERDCNLALRCFAKIFWNTWETISWIAWRTPEKILVIDDAAKFASAIMYPHNKGGLENGTMTATPEIELLVALQRGSIKATKGGTILKRQWWAEVDRVYDVDCKFESDDVREVWPPLSPVDNKKAARKPKRTRSRGPYFGKLCAQVSKSEIKSRLLLKTQREQAEEIRKLWAGQRFTAKLPESDSTLREAIKEALAATESK